MLIKKIKIKSSIHYLRQVHSNKIIKASDALEPNHPKADAITSNKSDQSLWIYTADCIPILLADKSKRNVSACHVGLKGLQNYILAKIIKKLEELGSHKKNILIALGPSISLKNYEVSSKEIKQIINSPFKINDLLSEKNPKYDKFLFTKETVDPKKILLDIQFAAVYQLLRIGIEINQIALNRICTYDNPKLFKSWRREQLKDRQWSYISS